jgi:hypothetical protein
MNNIGVFLRHTNGTFTDQIIYSTGTDSTPYAVAVIDFNKDQQLDIAVANFDSHNIGIFLGTDNGTFNIGVFLQDINGSFANPINFSTGYDSDPYALAVGDLNNDNKLDSVVVNYGTNNVGIFLRHGNGIFAIQIIFTTGINS